MATPLFWKAWELCNKVYDILLRYPYTFKMDLEAERFVMETLRKRLVPLFVFLFLMSTYLILYLTLIIHHLVMKTAQAEIHIVLLNLTLAGMIALCLALAIIMQACGHTVIIQHYNNLIRYEKDILSLSSFSQINYKIISALTLLKQGNVLEIH